MVPPNDEGAPRLRTALTDLLGIRHPILLAPMDGTAGGRLAAAVSAAGGLGFVGGGYCDVEALRRELALVREVRFGVGFITFALDERPEALRLALDADPVAVQLSFGDPGPHAAAVEDAGARLICGVQTTDEVDRALDAGADLLVAHGRDAGGHGRPDRGTMGLIPSVVDRVGGVPVVAAGGIVDGRGLAAALALGAAGVSMGTRFLASTEALSSPAEADALLAHGTEDTVRTRVIDLIRGPDWPDGHDGRVVRNALVERWEHDHAGLAARRDELKARYESAADDYSIRALWAGEGLDLITEIVPAATLVTDIVRQGIDEIQRTAGYVADPPID